MSERPAVFDRALHIARLQSHAGAPPVIEQHVAAELADRLSLVKRSFGKALLIAHCPRHFAEALKASGKIGDLAVITPPVDDRLEFPPQSLDAIFHLLDLQTVNDVPRLLLDMRAALKPDGLLMLACFGGETLAELRSAWLEAEEQQTAAASLRVAPMITVRDMGALLQHAGLALPVVDKDRTTVRYVDAFALMLELRAFGYSNPMIERSRRLVSRRLLGAVAETYARRYSDPDGRIRATLELIWATGWSPHESQQQPLKPGSATHSLAEALKTKERKL